MRAAQRLSADLDRLKNMKWLPKPQAEGGKMRITEKRGEHLAVKQVYSSLVTDH